MTTIRRVSPDERSDPALLNGLTTLLIDAVEGGASVGFLAPLPRPEAEVYWNHVLAAIGDDLILWVAEADGTIVGSGQLELCRKPNGRHRGEVQKLFVLSAYRGRGIARTLMETAESFTRSIGRTLLVLDTQVGSIAESVYRRLGWTKSGEIPNFAATPDGVLAPTALYYKILEPPFLLCSSLDPVECVFVAGSSLNAAFVSELRRLCPVPVQVIPNDPEHASDLWMQDAVEFGVRGEKTAALLGLRGQHDRGLTCAPFDRRVDAYLAERFPAIERIGLGEPLPNRRWIDWFGNLEVTPPLPGFPQGRVLIGRWNDLTPHPAALRFLEAQQAQWPPIVVDVSWLTIGHIDEVVNFVPAPDDWRCLLPSPALARDILREQAPDTRVFVGKTGERTVADLLQRAESDEQRAIEAHLAETEAQLIDALGIAPDRIIRLPALFEEGLALIPNPINSLVVDRTVLVPDPCFEPFRDAIETRLRPLGLTVHFLDIWEPYHVRSGEIHCGTNAIRRRSGRSGDHREHTIDAARRTPEEELS